MTKYGLKIVGWLLHRDNLCEGCRQRPAAVIVSRDGIDSWEMCRECVPNDVDDAIAEIFRRVESE